MSANEELEKVYSDEFWFARHLLRPVGRAQNRRQQQDQRPDLLNQALLSMGIANLQRAYLLLAFDLTAET